VNVLHKLHEALMPSGLLVDTQPVSPHPPVRTASHQFGTLDMTAWGCTIERIDGLTHEAVRAALFSLEDQRRFMVTDAFDTGSEMVEEAAGWAGTTIDPPLAERIAREEGPVTIDQEVRLRVLRANPVHTQKSRRPTRRRGAPGRVSS
jgi:hypothetical protein